MQLNEDAVATTTWLYKEVTHARSFYEEVVDVTFNVEIVDAMSRKSL